jgi:hypothetical protein
MYHLTGKRAVKNSFRYARIDYLTLVYQIDNQLIASLNLGKISF